MSDELGTAARMRGRRYGRLVALASLCLFSAVTASAQASTINLYAAPAATGAGDCGTPADACPIDTAVTNANAAGVSDSVRIELAGGTYALPVANPTALAITFAGPSLTLEAGSGATPILDGASTVRVLSVGAASNVTVDGLDIESGTTTGSGGGILNDGTLTVTRSTFAGNVAANGGAIADSAGATLTVQDSTFTHNSTTSIGGGAIISIGATTVERSAFIDNIASINGGAINVQGSGRVTLTSSTLARNTSGGPGGGLSNLGTIDVQASTLTDNTGTDGAAIATGNGNVTFAADVIGPQGTAAHACSPAVALPNPPIVDGGYNLDTDGTCILASAPATGSHNGTTAYGSSTYAAALAAYLADAPGDHGGPTPTVPLLNSPDPATTLANPAFAVVPATFDLPVAIDGISAACSIPDQRGVVPVPGAGCDIGAYQLQATTVAFATSPIPIRQNAPMTYTATVTPAADGGTVSFDDGAGNPARSQCAAQAVANGTATCTVIYPNVGDYSTTVTYSGDGAGNHFAPSPSTTQTVTVAPPLPGAPAAAPAPAPVVKAPDRTPPTSRMRHVAKLNQPITLHGTAADSAGAIRRVRVSVARHIGKLCRFLGANHRFSTARSCTKSSYVDAKGTSSWSLKLTTLPTGRYTIWSRAIDAAGNVERKNRTRNLLVLRIPARRAARAAVVQQHGVGPVVGRGAPIEILR
jgi:hypothetical protein